MGQASKFIPALCFLAIVAHQPTARADEPKDNGKEWVEGSVWKGSVKQRGPDGRIRTGDVTMIITKRDGKSFEGRYEFDDGEIALEFEGEIEATGKIKLTVTKIAKASDAARKSTSAKNIVGLKGSGTVDGKTTTWKYVQPQADNPKGAPATGTVKVKLKE